MIIRTFLKLSLLYCPFNTEIHEVNKCNNVLSYSFYNSAVAKARKYNLCNFNYNIIIVDACELRLQCNVLAKRTTCKGARVHTL